MLHVILLILKIIGIILAVLLGLVLLAVMLVLFVPCRYRAQIEKKETLTVKIKIHWLMHLFCIPIYYQEQVSSAKMKFCGFVIKDFCAEEKEPPKTSAKKKSKKKTEETKESVLSENSGNERVAGEKSIQVKENFSAASAKPKGFKKKIFAGFLRKIRNLKYTIREFCDKIKKIIRKIRETKEFVLDSHTKEAFKLSLGQALTLLKKIFPKNIRGEVHFGTEDPALTGEILGGISIFYPFFMDNVNVIPDFEQPCLECELFLKGRLHGITFLRIAWKLFWDKNIRMVYQKLSA